MTTIRHDFKSEVFSQGFSKTERKKIKKTFILLAVTFTLSALALIYLLLASFERSRFFEVSEDLQNKSNAAVKDFSELIEVELRRPFVDYGLSNLPSIGLNNFLKISPLSRMPPDSRIPGLLGFFQINPGKFFESPVLPAYGLRNIENLNERISLSRTLYTVLKSANPLSDLKKDQMFFDEAIKGVSAPFEFDPNLIEKNKDTVGLSLSELKLDETFSKGMKSGSKKSLAKSMPNKKLDIEPSVNAAQTQVATISKEVSLNPFKVLLLDSGHIVFIRTIFRSKNKLLQGFMVEQKEFFEGLFRNLNLQKEKERSGSYKLSLIFQNKVLGVFQNPSPSSIVLLKEALPGPLNDIQYLFSVSKLSLSSQQHFLLLTIILVLTIVLVGLNVGYRNSIRQMDLFDTQNNFVSAVNHELRTPLTAIRMHSEMLVNDWVSTQEQKKIAYGYILSESERLSRLIENVLRFSRTGREADNLRLEQHSISSMMDSVLSRIQPLVDQSSFSLNFSSHVDSGVSVNIDKDAFYQVFLNLTDNAIKFSRESANKKIDVSVQKTSNLKEICITLRDYGPGISKDLGEKVFDLFVRAENELTRTTSGTGIGLALVRKMLSQMNGRINYSNLDQGCEFRIILPVT